MFEVCVQAADFNVDKLQQRLTEGQTEAGALVAFTGLVRSGASEPVIRMLLEHYPGMTERSIQEIIEQANERWQLLSVLVIHRVGTLYPGEQIVYVGVCARHRGDAFVACEFIMDYLKTRAPFWKKEFTPHGEQWVEARASDTDAAARWQVKATTPI